MGQKIGLWGSLASIVALIIVFLPGESNSQIENEPVVVQGESNTVR